MYFWSLLSLIDHQSFLKTALVTFVQAAVVHDTFAPRFFGRDFSWSLRMPCIQKNIEISKLDQKKMKILQIKNTYIILSSSSDSLQS